MGDAVEQAIKNLLDLTTCGCGTPLFTEHEPDCYAYFREDVDLVVNELAQARAALAYEISRRTVGGRPPAVDKTWANITMPPPSASDPTAAPHRRVGMARSDDHLKGSGT